MQNRQLRALDCKLHRGADGIVVVYDVTSKESYDHIDGWLAEALRHTEEKPRILLIGNKAELEPRQVQPAAPTHDTIL